MGISIARVGDMTVGSGSHGMKCCGHTFTGTIIQGSMNVMVNGSPCARVTDITAHGCPHCGIGMVIGSSGMVKSNSLGIARLGDSVTEFCGSGTIISGSPNVNAG